MRRSRFQVTGPALVALAMLGCSGGGSEPANVVDAAPEVAVEVADDVAADQVAPADGIDVAETAVDVVADVLVDATDALADVTGEDIALPDQQVADAADVAEPDVQEQDVSEDALAQVSGCILCHTNKLKLQELLPVDPGGAPETAAG